MRWSIVRDDVMSAAVMATAAGHACLVDEDRDYRKLLDDSIERLSARGAVALRS